MYDQPDSALVLADKMMILVNKKNDLFYRVKVESTKGIAYYLLGNIQNSLLFFNESLKLRKELAYQNTIITSSNNLATIYVLVENLPEANKYSQLANKVSKRLNSPTYLKGTYQ